MAKGDTQRSTMDWLRDWRDWEVHNSPEWAAARQKYQTEYESGEQVLPLGLKGFLDVLPYFTHTGEALNELLKRRGDMRAVQQRTPGACPALVELIARAFKLSPEVIAAALGLPTQHDALDTLLLDIVRRLAPNEVKNGLLPLSHITAAVNADRNEHEALSPALLASRLRVLGFPFTRSHPTCLIWMPNLLPSLVPTVDVPSARENGNNIQ